MTRVHNYYSSSSTSLGFSIALLDLRIQVVKIEAIVYAINGEHAWTHVIDSSVPAALQIHKTAPVIGARPSVSIIAAKKEKMSVVIIPVKNLTMGFSSEGANAFLMSSLVKYSPIFLVIRLFLLYNFYYWRC